MPLALLIHGTPDKEEYFNPELPSPSNAHWFPWLQKQLILAGYETQTPEMPLSYHPEYRAWAQEFERYTITSETLLIGHSCGGGFLLRWLSENKVNPKRVVLVAPWLDPDRNHCTPGFFDFMIDKSLPTRTDLHLLYSDNDTSDVDRSINTIFDRIPQIQKHLIRGAGHFVGVDRFEIIKAIALYGASHAGA